MTWTEILTYTACGLFLVADGIYIFWLKLKIEQDHRDQWKESCVFAPKTGRKAVRKCQPT